jgi:hypothetical protein
MVATFAEFDSRPGRVRDRLAQARESWLGLLEREVAIAQAAGDIPDSPPADMLAFEIDALLSAANIARNFADDEEPLSRARALIALRLGEPGARRNRSRR